METQCSERSHFRVTFKRLKEQTNKRSKTNPYGKFSLRLVGSALFDLHVSRRMSDYHSFWNIES